MQLLKLSEVAKLLRVSNLTVRRWVGRRDLHAYKHERNERYLFDPEVIEAFIKNGYKVKECK